MRRVTRVAISTDDNKGLDSVVSPHFGRCPYYVLVDLEDRQVRQVSAVENPYYGYHQPGQVPGFIEHQGADVDLRPLDVDLEHRGGREAFGQPVEGHGRDEL